jgi:hypothetical protein
MAKGSVGLITPDCYVQERGKMKEFNEWLQVGIENKWVSPSFCETHDGVPLSYDEEEEAEEHGEYPCVHVLRLFESPELFTEVKERNPQIFGS